MEAKEYKLLDGRTIRAKYDRLGMCKISQENLELFVKEFNTSYRQAKILEKIKENYALIKSEERKVGKWISDGHGHIVCTACNEVNVSLWKSKYCPCCGVEMRGVENE